MHSVYKRIPIYRKLDSSVDVLATLQTSFTRKKHYWRENKHLVVYGKVSRNCLRFGSQGTGFCLNEFCLCVSLCTDVPSSLRKNRERGPFSAFFLREGGGGRLYTGYLCVSRIAHEQYMMNSYRPIF